MIIKTLQWGMNRSLTNIPPKARTSMWTFTIQESLKFLRNTKSLRKNVQSTLRKSMILDLKVKKGCQKTEFFEVSRIGLNMKCNYVFPTCLKEVFILFLWSLLPLSFGGTKFFRFLAIFIVHGWFYRCKKVIFGWH